MHDASDMDLLRQYADGNSDAAFAALVSRHVDLVYSAALRKAGNPHAAEEITQAVFIILAQKAGRIVDKTILPGWLYQTARLTASSFLRRETRRVRREQEAFMQSQFDDLSRRSETKAETWEQIAPLLEDAMGQLGDRDRAAVVMRFFGGKSFAEVAAAAGVSENAAKKRVGYALEKLHRYFSKRGVSSTTAIIAGAISVNSVQAAPVTLAKAVTAVALAKGAAASGSTLTLIQGALKIMAWSKAKTAAVSTVAIMLTGGTTTLVVETVHLSRVGVYQPIRDNEPEITARVRGLKMEELRAEDCTPEFWRQLHQSPLFNNPAVVKGLAAALGPLRTVTLVERTEIHGRPNYLYRMKYQKMNVLFLIVFDGEKIAFAKGYPEPK